ncbi:hypothetical protein KHS38_12100 [Mucilaginibacter sp. Bleaf8]|uniref:hypothetical protein n=1 Tax=Mucilaginibacter sp. Bleaf8 TaxID=2834430 RepID=UPI001BCB7366|nr:hypothetical protein [Mucilaginibacter sp. Bleaf8]MBS7565147.1 hypothetical protein [Mucilaginibacter sp. Bleaf8]
MYKRPAKRTMPAYDPANDIGAVDRIRFAMINNRMNELTEPEFRQLERWKQVDDWIRSRRYQGIGGDGKLGLQLIPNQRFIRNLIISTYNVSWDTAERDIRNTQKLFSSRADDREYHRAVYIEQAEQRAEEAAASGDHKAAYKYLELAANLRGLFTEQPEEEDNEKLQALQFIIEYNPEAVGLKTIENKDEVFARWMKKKASISDAMNKDAEEAKYE